MGLLRLAVLGTPEVFHDGTRLSFALRKAQALLLYLAVEGGMHSRSKLAAFLWPDSEPADARKTLRNAIALLRRLLDDPATTPARHSHLLSQQELLGLNFHAPLELDLDVVQRAWKPAQESTTFSSEQQRTSLLAQWQDALSLVRGPFLDGFWLGEDAPFDEWVQQQQQHWQVRMQGLCDRLSCLQEISGEQESAKTTLMRWLALDPLSEEVSRRLMRLYLAQGDLTAGWQVYATCRVRLAQELQIQPSSETVALAEHIRTSAARRRGDLAAPASAIASQPSSELVVPLIGRSSAFSQLVARYQLVRQRQAQGVLVVGEVGLGKTRLAREFVGWAKAQGADVLSGQAFEMSARLPYQPLVEALRSRLEVENAPEDLLEDLWLAELSRLLPELRVRYPDLPPPSGDELTAKLRLFEAVARLLDVLAKRAPLVLLLDDLHWLDEASLDLVRYLGHWWKEHGSRALLLFTMRSEELARNGSLTWQLLDLGHDLPLTHVPLQPLSQAETRQLLQALAHELEPAAASRANAELQTPAARASKRSLEALGDVLFAQTGGQPWYLLETLKLLRERLRLEPSRDLAPIFAQELSWRELVPSSVRVQVLGRLAKLSPAAREVVRAAAVLGGQTSAPQLWQVAGVGVQTGIEALEEAIGSGLLREVGSGSGHAASYGFTNKLIRQVVAIELGEARRQVLSQRAPLSDREPGSQGLRIRISGSPGLRERGRLWRERAGQKGSQRSLADVSSSWQQKRFRAQRAQCEQPPGEDEES